MLIQRITKGLDRQPVRCQLPQASRSRREACGHGPHRRGPREAFTLLELMLVVTLVLFAVMAMSRSIVGSIKLTETNRETALATDGMRHVLESIQGVEEFSEVFAMYNADPADDPAGVECPGSGFAVVGLAPADDDPDGFVGEIVFPTMGLELREDLVDEGFGMPRDLNGDGVVDGANHAGDYRLLPVLLRLRWQGSGPESSLEVRTLIADR